VFDAFCARQSTPARAPRRAKGQPTPWPAPAPIKRPVTLTVPLRTRSTSPELKLTGVCPSRRVRGHSSPCHRRPANRALPDPVQPSEETVHTSVKLPEQGIGVCFAGEASPRSPDSTRPSASVDRVSYCAIFQFNAQIASTSPREAHRAIGLD
jgi:hypothetical protein